MTAAARQPRRVGSRRRRGFYAITSILLVLAVGTVGFHSIEGLSYVDAFYFESMLATGQGPPIQLATDPGKVFASIMGFISVGAVATTLVLTLGPALLDLWREGLEAAEREVLVIEHEFGEKKARGGRAEPRKTLSQSA